MVFAVSFGLGAAGFLVLVLLTLLNRRPKGFGLGVLLTCVATAVWAMAAASSRMPGVAHGLESLRSGAWLVLLASIVAVARQKEHAAPRTSRLVWIAAGIGLLCFANDCRFLLAAAAPTAFAPSQVLARVLVSVCGILAVENLYRNTSPGRRWNVIPLCIAIGAMFAYDLYVFSEAVVLKSVSAPLLAGRGVLLALIAPLLVLALARNPGWNIDIHVSRRIVFHGATLTAAGMFLLAAAGVAMLIGRFPGQWASVSEIGFFCASAILLAVALSTESIRSRLRRLIAENFYSTRYDYRAEWLRTVSTLSSAGASEPLAARAIRAIADVVDSPGGALWLEDASGDYRVVQTLAMALDRTAIETSSGAFIAGFRGREAVQVLADDRPAWAGQVWLAVPLLRIERMIGFVVLAYPRAPAALGWESSDLLLAIGQQVAAYLEEERAMRALLESQALIEYSRKFSFVIHDIKNVSGQLGLMISNVAKFGERAEFRADLVRGLEGCAKKLRNLVDKVRPDAPVAEAPRIVDPAEVIAEIVGALAREDRPVRARLAAEATQVPMAPADLQAVLTHLVTNAMEASSGGDEVTVELRRDRGRLAIDVIDRGSGMSAEFVRNNLFVPLHSTKSGGHGIGAFQARHLIRAAGGDLEVLSAVGRGTTMRILLPEPHRAAAPLCEALAS
jgi:putative PEP-CTERM system histidine kinase